MTRHQRFDVRVAPEVERVLSEADRSGTPLRARFLTQMDRLAANGTDARSVKKLTNHELWEVRAGSYRAFFRPVLGTRTIAVGVLAAKRTKRLSAVRLRIIERQVQTWVDELSDEA
jgi:hypothetical protein